MLIISVPQGRAESVALPTRVAAQPLHVVARINTKHVGEKGYPINADVLQIPVAGEAERMTTFVGVILHAMRKGGRHDP